MNPEKPYLFIGSSQESRERHIVDAFVTAFSDDAHCIPWYRVPQFSTGGSATTFGALCEATAEYDFAVFLFTPDDTVESRGATKGAPRDNVVFELGLFVNAIGPTRVLAFVQESDRGLKIPSDLAAVNAPRFWYDESESRKSLASIEEKTRGFATTIRERGFRKIDMQIAHEWGFNTTTREFQVDLSAAKLTRARSVIGKWQVVIAARVQDPNQNLEDDRHVVYTNPRSLPATLDDNVPFVIPESQFKQAIEPGSKIQARVVLVPESVTFDPSATLGEAVNARCREVESMSYRLAETCSKPK